MFDYIASLKEPDITEEIESLSTEDLQAYNAYMMTKKGSLVHSQKDEAAEGSTDKGGLFGGLSSFVPRSAYDAYSYLYIHA